MRERPVVIPRPAASCRPRIGHGRTCSRSALREGEFLQDAMRPDGALRLDLFCERATEDFARLRSARPEDRLLSLGVVGFVAAAETNERQVTQVLVGNSVVHEDGKAPRLAPFTWRGGTYPADSGETFALVGGAIDQTLQPSLGRITQLLEGGRPARAVVHRAVDLIRAAAERDSRVGAQCSSGIVHRSGGLVYDYHTSYPVKRIYSPTIVTPQKVFLGVMVERLSEGVGPSPRVATSAPCPCRSGKRYGRCHGLAIMFIGPTCSAGTSVSLSGPARPKACWTSGTPTSVGAAPIALRIRVSRTTQASRSTRS